jgi:hypothetical protein
MAVNPFGEDETDIDLDVLLESHIDVMYPPLSIDTPILD